MEVIDFSYNSFEDNYKDQNSFGDTMSLNFLENTFKINVGTDWVWTKEKSTHTR